MRHRATAIESCDYCPLFANSEQLGRPFVTPFLVVQDVLSDTIVPARIPHATRQPTAIRNVFNQGFALFHTADSSFNLRRIPFVTDKFVIVRRVGDARRDAIGWEALHYLPAISDKDLILDLHFNLCLRRQPPINPRQPLRQTHHVVNDRVAHLAVQILQLGFRLAVNRDAEGRDAVDLGVAQRHLGVFARVAGVAVIVFVRLSSSSSSNLIVPLLAKNSSLALILATSSTLVDATHSLSPDSHH